MSVYVLVFKYEIQVFTTCEGAKEYAEKDLGVTARKVDKSTWTGVAASGDELCIVRRSIFPR
jgi:hypothetical protein